MGAATSSRNPRPALRPGEMAPVTGIYRVVHQEHRPDHDAVVIRGENFPACRTCKGAVRFIVQTQASHLMHDFDFAGPIAGCEEVNCWSSVQHSLTYRPVPSCRRPR